MSKQVWSSVLSCMLVIGCASEPVQPPRSAVPVSECVVQAQPTEPAVIPQTGDCLLIAEQRPPTETEQLLYVFFDAFFEIFLQVILNTHQQSHGYPAIHSVRKR